MCWPWPGIWGFIYGWAQLAREQLIVNRYEVVPNPGYYFHIIIMHCIMLVHTLLKIHTHSRAFLHRNYTHLSVAMPHTSACPECSLVTINMPSFCRRTKGFHKKPPSHSVLGIGLYLRPGLFNSFGLFEHRSKNFMHFRCGDITVLLRSL